MASRGYYRARHTPAPTQDQQLARWGRELDRRLADKKHLEKRETKMAAPDLSNYVDVATRLRLLHEKYPMASVYCHAPKIIIIEGHTFIEVTAHIDCGELAYETGEVGKPKSATASAWEPFPGKTPYTRDSEMMNAETSAIGRAIGALGIGLTGSMASANEVVNRQGDTVRTTVVNNTTVTQVGNPPSDKQLWLYKKLLKDAGKVPPLNIDQMDKFEVSRAIEALKAGEAPEEAPLPDEEPF